MAAVVDTMPLKIHIDGEQIDPTACSAICKPYDQGNTGSGRFGTPLPQPAPICFLIFFSLGNAVGVNL